ncbi:hypothetical protein AMELA_G00195670 [Ameiurus melas]|uniref:Uncharacterized protein n=1 Tax=Ameiurus melas TaxID=219545 RepID=A0A7J6A824_AMEME|nr:hypothetical protein AMELA_G00195670 [Ameiurus melas]
MSFRSAGNAAVNFAAEVNQRHGRDSTSWEVNARLRGALCSTGTCLDFGFTALSPGLECGLCFLFNSNIVGGCPFTGKPQLYHNSLCSFTQRETVNVFLRPKETLAASPDVLAVTEKLKQAKGMNSSSFKTSFKTVTP